MNYKEINANLRRSKYFGWSFKGIYHCSLLWFECVDLCKKRGWYSIFMNPKTGKPFSKRKVVKNLTIVIKQLNNRNYDHMSKELRKEETY